MDFKELMQFYEELTKLRNEYAQSDNCYKVELIATLVQVCSEVIRQGKIPSYFQVKHLLPYNEDLLISPVEELFKRLSIDVNVFDEGRAFFKEGEVRYVNFIVKSSHP